LHLNVLYGYQNKEELCLIQQERIAFITEVERDYCAVRAESYKTDSVLPKRAK
jgi:hypothetical protein